MEIDRKLFSELFEHYGADVRRVLRRRIPEAYQDDLVHDVFVIAMNEHDLSLDTAKPWLLVTAHNVARNWHRRRKERPELVEPADGRPSPEQLASDREIHACVHSILDSLPDELRIVLTLVRLEDIPIDQVARMLNVPRGKVQSMLRRAESAFIAEARRRDAVGALLSLLALLAVIGQSRLRATINECFKYGSGAAVGAGLVLALTHPQAIPTLIHVERPQLAATYWSGALLPAVPSPPGVDVPAAPPDVPAAPVPPAGDPRPSTPTDAGPAPVDVVRDELMLLERAARAMDQGKYEKARQYLERHLHIYPRGKASAIRERLFGRLNQLTGRSTKT